MTNPTTIARSLSEAQRAAVLGKRRLDSGAGMWPLRHSLDVLGLVKGLSATPTPLWHAVRAAVLAEQEGVDAAS